MVLPVISIRSRLVAGAVAAVLLVAPLAAQATTAANQGAVASGLAYLTSQQQADGQIAGFSGINPWALMAYTATGQGNANLRSYLVTHAPAANASATDWEKAILAITADHQNPYTFGGTNYVASLKALHHDGQIGSLSAVNDDAFGVLALVAARVPVADSALVDAVSFVLAHQHADGGFSYSTDVATGSDVDDTAAIIMALRAAQAAGVNQAGLAGAIVNARAYMLATQNEDGGFPYDPLTPPDWGGPASNVSTTSWVIMALQSLGEGGTTASTDAQAFVRSAQQNDGSFPYQSGAGDTFDTAYAVAALAGSTWPQAIYDGPLPAVTSPSPSPSPSLSPSPTPGSVLGAADTTGTPGATLPSVGTWANAAILLLGAVISIVAGLWVYRRQGRQAQN